MGVLENFYKRNYKMYIGITLIFFIVMGLFAFLYPGFTRGIDLSGGTLLIARTDKPIDAKQLEDFLSEKFDLVDLSVSSISSPTGYGVTIKFAENKLLSSADSEIALAKSSLAGSPETAAQHAHNALETLKEFAETGNAPQNPVELVNFADLAFIEAKENINREIQRTITEKFGLTEEIAFQIKEVSPTLGESFWQTAITVVLVVLVLVVFVVFFFFREFIPSVVVLSCGLFDGIFCLGMMALLGIPLTLNTIPALLMLFGYSIDTDVMLASRILKRKDRTPAQRASSSMPTGFTMTGTTIAAVLVMISLSYIYQVEVIFAIGSVLFLGLIGDLIGTWLWSAPILLWNADRKQAKRDAKFGVRA